MYLLAAHTIFYWSAASCLAMALWVVPVRWVRWVRWMGRLASGWLGCAWHRTSGCAKRMEGVGWLGSPAMAFYLGAGVASMRNAVAHRALPAPARIWAALDHLCFGPPPARCAGCCARAWRCLMSAPPARSVDGVAGMLAAHLPGRRIRRRVVASSTWSWLKQALCTVARQVIQSNDERQ